MLMQMQMLMQAGNSILCTKLYPTLESHLAYHYFTPINSGTSGGSYSKVYDSGYKFAVKLINSWFSIAHV